MEKTEKLNDEDRFQSLKDAEKHRAKIGKITQEVEAILLREEMTWGDWGEVIDLLTARTHAIVSSLTLKQIKKDYDGRN